MKISDYFSIFGLAIVGTIIAYFLTNSILGDPIDKTVSFEYIEVVSPDLIQPDSELFNSGAINPTVEIYVGSCKDLNQDGQIDAGELAECGQKSPESKAEQSDEDSGTEESDETSQGGSTNNQGGSTNSGSRTE